MCNGNTAIVLISIRGKKANNTFEILLLLKRKKTHLLWSLQMEHWLTLPTEGKPIRATRASPDFITSKPSPLTPADLEGSRSWALYLASLAFSKPRWYSVARGGRNEFSLWKTVSVILRFVIEHFHTMDDQFWWIRKVMKMSLVYYNQGWSKTLAAVSLTSINYIYFKRSKNRLFVRSCYTVWRGQLLFVNWVVSIMWKIVFPKEHLCFKKKVL